MLKFKTIALISFISVALMTKTALAEENSDETKEKPWLKFKEKREEMVQKRCETLGERIDKKLEKYNEGEKQQGEKFDRLVERINKIVAAAEERELDTSKLIDDLARYEEKIELAKAGYSDYIAKLTETKEYACGDSEGKFGEAVKSARTEMQTVRSLISEVHLFYKSTIRPDLTELKMQWGEGQVKQEEN